MGICSQISHTVAVSHHLSGMQYFSFLYSVIGCVKQVSVLKWQINGCSAQAIKLTSSEEDHHEKVHFPVLIKDYGGTYIYKKNYNDD